MVGPGPHSCLKCVVFLSLEQMRNWLRPVPLLAGLALGCYVVFGYNQPKREIFDYPHPTNNKDAVYKDPTGACYKYTSKEVDCDANEKTLQQFPVQG